MFASSVLKVIAVMAGIVIVIIVVLGEAGAAEHCLAEIVRFNVLLECLGDMNTFSNTRLRMMVSNVL